MVKTMAKYPWGDNPVDDRVFGVSLLWTGTLFTLFLRYIVPADGLPAIDSGMAFKETFSKKGEPLGGGVAGTVLATLAFVWVHWNGMGIQVFTRMMKQNLSDGASYCTGRIMGNLLEHSVVYLPLLWLHCAYINSKEAQYLGLMYAGLRFLYHVIFGVFGEFTYAIEFSTGPSMAVVYYFFNSLLCKALLDQEWKDYLPSNPILMVPFVIAQSLFFFLVVWGLPTGHLVSGLVDAARPAKKKM